MLLLLIKFNKNECDLKNDCIFIKKYLNSTSDIKIFCDFKEKFNVDTFDFKYLTNNYLPKEQNK